MNELFYEAFNWNLIYFSCTTDNVLLLLARAPPASLITVVYLLWIDWMFLFFCYPPITNHSSAFLVCRRMMKHFQCFVPAVHFSLLPFSFCSWRLFFFSFSPIFFPTWPPYPCFPRPFLALTALFIPCLSFHSFILRFSYPFFFGSIHGFAFKSATEIELLPNHTDWTNHTQNIRIQLNYYRIKMMKCICHTPFHLRFTIPIIY